MPVVPSKPVCPNSSPDDEPEYGLQFPHLCKRSTALLLTPPKLPPFMTVPHVVVIPAIKLSALLRPN